MYNENITCNLNEYDTADITDINKLLSEFEELNLAQPLAAHADTMDFFVNYETNYNLKQLLLICDYYNISKELKQSKAKKLEIINAIFVYENNVEHIETVIMRKHLWFYMNELKNDKFMKKFVLW